VAESPVPSASGFPPVDSAAWRARVEADLGAAGAAALAARTLAGLTVEPCYGEAPGDAPPLLRARTWCQAPRLCCVDPAAANAELLADLRGGASACWWMADVERLDDAGFERLVAEVALGAIEVHVDSGDAPAGVAERLFARAAQSPLHGSLGADPLGAWARRGRPARAMDACWDEAAALTERCVAEQPAVRALGLSAEAPADAGAHAVQELAFLLASTAETWRALDARGVAPGVAAQQTLWRLTVGADSFGALAKLRAARRLFRRMAAACGVEGLAADGRLHAVAARRTLARRDPWSNLLRATTQAWAALLGGADVWTATCWDEALGRPSADARRLSRNLALVLAEEGALDAVADPAAGSGHFEARTEDLAQAAWLAFQDLERRGGLAAVLADGSFRDEVDATARARRERLESGESAVVGVTAFPPQHADVLAAAQRAIDAAEAWPGDAALPAEEGDAACAAGAFPLRRDADDGGSGA